MTENGQLALGEDDAEEYSEALLQSWSGLARLTNFGVEKLGIPSILGLSDEEWLQRRLAGKIKYAPSERKKLSAHLTASTEDGGAGLSNVKAAEVLGVDEKTVRNDRGDSEKSEPAQAETANPQVAEPSDVVDSEKSEPLPLADIDEPAEEPAAAVAQKPKAHVANNSGDNEWFTPPELIRAARRVLGFIDLDPASSAIANEVVGAETFYTAEDDGLEQDWAGRVWMNPPYAQPLVDRFCARLAREYSEGDVTEACVLVNNATETAWFQTLAAASSAACFIRGRIKFWHPDKESAQPLQGQAVLYLGDHTDRFRRDFLKFGFVAVMRDG